MTHYGPVNDDPRDDGQRGDYDRDVNRRGDREPWDGDGRGDLKLSLRDVRQEESKTVEKTT